MHTAKAECLSKEAANLLSTKPKILATHTNLPFSLAKAQLK